MSSNSTLLCSKQIALTSWPLVELLPPYFTTTTIFTTSAHHSILTLGDPQTVHIVVVTPSTSSDCQCEIMNDIEGELFEGHNNVMIDNVGLGSSLTLLFSTHAM